MKKILITKTLNETNELKVWSKKNGLRLHEVPFIKVTPVKGLNIPETDWIFFSSPQSVSIYFENYLLKAKKIAALSSGTAKALSERNFSVVFVGDSSKRTMEIGRDFFSLVPKNETVFFPLSAISRKHVSSQNIEHKIIETILYQTQPIEEKIDEDFAAIIFTSPSNVDGYLVKNNIPQKSRIIAIGETTATILKLRGFLNVETSRSADMKGIIELLEKQSS